MQDSQEKGGKKVNGIPKRYLNADLGDFDSTYISPLLTWVSEPKNFSFIYSGAGTGKTHLGVAIAKKIAGNGVESGFVCAPDIFLKLRKSFDRDATESEWDIIKNYRKPIVGIFDDVASNNCRDYVVEAWYNIINFRYNECIPSLFTSNYSIEEISSMMGDRIASRLASGLVFKLAGEDRRLK